jgi:hypothetical protein
VSEVRVIANQNQVFLMITRSEVARVKIAKASGNTVRTSPRNLKSRAEVHEEDFAFPRGRNIDL